MMMIRFFALPCQYCASWFSYPPQPACDSLLKVTQANGGQIDTGAQVGEDKITNEQ
jgi:hypothetical protein